MSGMRGSWRFVVACDMQPGSPRSFRFNPQHAENWHTAMEQLRAEEGTELLLVGGDLTRDGSLHDFELEEVKRDLDSIAIPYYVVPGNMDTGNKNAPTRGAWGRDDPGIQVQALHMERFARVYRELPWTFDHRGVRFSGIYAAVAGTGIPQEEAMWHFLENKLPSLPPVRHHVMLMHYALFIDDVDEPAWDLTNADEYLNWYFCIDPPHRQRIFAAFKAAGVSLVFSGHIHCRRGEQVVGGMRFLKCPGIAFPQWEDRWPDGDARLGYMRCEVEEGPTGALHTHFVPLLRESKATGAYGPSGHPKPEERDYTLAWER